MSLEINTEILQNFLDADNIQCSKLNLSATTACEIFIKNRDPYESSGFLLINKQYPIFIFSNDVSIDVSMDDHILHFAFATVKIDPACQHIEIESDVTLFLNNLNKDYILVAIHNEDSYDNLLYHIEDYYNDTRDSMQMTANYKNLPDDIDEVLSTGDTNVANIIADTNTFVKDSTENIIDDFMKTTTIEEDEEALNESLNIETNNNNLFII